MLTGNGTALWDAEPSAVVLRWCGGRGKDGGYMEDSLLPPLATFDSLDNISIGTNILKVEK